MLSRIIQFLLLLVLSLCTITKGMRPSITPDTDELHLKEGDALEIICTHFTKLYFFYPQDVINEIKTSTPLMEEREINGIHETVFRRSSTVRGDTGFYGCADHDVEVNMKSYDDPEIAWIYVYVKSNATAFVQTTTDAISLREVSGETIFITCRPNSPNYKIYLDNDEQNIEEIADRLTYNPRFGFALGNLTVTDSMFYYCKCNETDPNDEITYILHITKKHILNKPIIMEENLRHVVSGQELHVNCSVDVAKGVDYIVNWTLPFQWKKENGGNKDARIYTKFHDNGISELIIKNVTEQDEGDYYCNLVTHYDMKRTKIYLTVHNPNIKYINLTSHTSDPVYHRKYGDNVQWIVLIDGYPQPKIRWINPKGDEIIATWKDPDRTKYAVEITNTKTVLKINRLIVEDMGIYTLQAMNEERIETLNFTLEVAGKPVVVVDSVKPYYNWNKTAYYHSQIIGFPPPNVTWTYLSCPNYPLKDTCSENTLQNTKVIPVKETEFSSTARMNMEMSGLITCKACNAFGCDMALEVILVSDVDKGFGIIEPRDAVTEGDDIVLTCAASVYNFTDNLVWMYDDEKPILQSERIKIKKHETPFSYRSNLEIKDVKQSNSGLYLCDSMNKEDQSFSERVQYNLTVHRPRAPEINSNMNGTEITFNLDTESQNTVKLSCAIIQGMPKPNITWYKDDKELQKHEQYLFLRHNQDLWIKYLLERDSGKYSCRASNRIGTAESYQIITVKGRGIPFYVIIAFLVLVIVTVVIVAFFGVKFRRERVMRKQLMEAGLMHFEEGALECLNPDLTVDDQAELLPYDRKWEFPREKLKLGKQLGSGAFGVVMKAEAQGICEEEAITTVAVKMVRRTTEATYIRALASELKIMVHLGKHLNVVNLLGACTKNISKRELLVIVEYCRFGNLHNYLLRHRSNFINQIDPATGRLDLEIGRDLMRSPSICSNRIKYAALSFSRSISANSDNSTTGPETVAYYHRQGPDSGSVTLAPDGCVLSNSSVQPGWRSNYRGDYKDHNLKPICTQDLLSWAFQVARGMEYLSNRRVLHGDLAARNILLAENNIVKICDFGLAKTMYKDDNYKKKGDAPLPVKWMAIESIRDRVFSTQSDIWSFGIVLWEFFTLAETPYPGMEAEKQYQKLIEGYRLEQPEYATKEVYDIMLQCWKAKATLRPSFADLVDGIGELLEESVKMHYVDLNEPYLDMNTRNLETGKNDYLTMMSAPDHTALSSPTGDYVNSPLSMTQNENDSTYLCMSPDGKNGDESGIFSPRPNSEKSKFEFPSTLSDSDGDSTVELSPMLKKSDEEDPYLKPINVNARRAEFVRKREEASKNNKMTERPVERDSGYCNTLKNLHLIDLNTHSHSLDDTDSVRSSKNNADYVPSIIRTPDNYVNMPKQKSDLLKDMSNVPTGFSNPSYIMMNNNESAEPSV